jgi:hypothetical protein
MTHAGYARSERQGGALANRIDSAIVELTVIPVRDEAWQQAWDAAVNARELLPEGRRAKAGKVLLTARQYLER